MIFGYRGSMKSFLALDWAGCLATGKTWQNRQVTKPGKVLYVASEGAHGLSNRLESWEKAWHKEIASDRFVTLGAAPNLGSKLDVAEVCALVDSGDFDYVFIDTFAKCVVGMEENSNRDMGVAVQSLYQIQEATDGGTVVAIHHTGKDRTTSRGASAIEAGVDTVYLTEKTVESVMRLSRTKRKDGPEEDEMELHLAPVEYTHSAVLQRQTGAAEGMGRQKHALMEIYYECFSATGCSKKELLAASMMPEPHFYRAFNALLETGQLADIGTPNRPHYRSEAK